MIINYSLSNVTSDEHTIGSVFTDTFFTNALISFINDPFHRFQLRYRSYRRRYRIQKFMYTNGNK